MSEFRIPETVNEWVNGAVDEIGPHESIVKLTADQRHGAVKRRVHKEYHRQHVMWNGAQYIGQGHGKQRPRGPLQRRLGDGRGPVLVFGLYLWRLLCKLDRSRLHAIPEIGVHVNFPPYDDIDTDESRRNGEEEKNMKYVEQSQMLQCFTTSQASETLQFKLNKVSDCLDIIK